MPPSFFWPAARGDRTGRIRYGGVTFGYSRMMYRVYAPCARTGNPNTQGSIINVGGGWGNDANMQQSHTGRVRVTAGPDSTPDYDSGWVEAVSGLGPSYWELSHGLGATPARVRVIAKAVSGLDEGFVYDGMGGAQTDDDHVRDWRAWPLHRRFFTPTLG